MKNKRNAWLKRRNRRQANSDIWKIAGDSRLHPAFINALADEVVNTYDPESVMGCGVADAFGIVFSFVLNRQDRTIFILKGDIQNDREYKELNAELMTAT